MDVKRTWSNNVPVVIRDYGSAFQQGIFSDKRNLVAAFILKTKTKTSGKSLTVMASMNFNISFFILYLFIYSLYKKYVRYFPTRIARKLVVAGQDKYMNNTSYLINPRGRGLAYEKGHWGCSSSRLGV